MSKNRPLALVSAGAVVVALVGAVGFMTVGEAVNAAPPAQQTTTTTDSGTSAMSPVAQHTPVRLTATVTPVTAGTVQLEDGITNLGAPVQVSNSTASASASAVTPRPHPLIAVFPPHPLAAYSPSASPAVTFAVAGASVTTTTTLTASPLSPVMQGTLVMLTATITPARAVGNVQFKDGANNLGPSVRIRNGVAQGSTSSSLIAGLHQLTAVFSPTDPGAFSASISSPVAFVVTPAASPVATSTALATSPSSPAVQGAPATLTATITPATATGTVQFKDGTRNLGNPVAVINGTASGSTSTLPIGSRSLIAAFTTNAPALYASSTSTPVEYVITVSSRGTATSTAVTNYPGSPVRRGTPMTVIATVSPTKAAGAIQFKDGVVNLGNPVIVSNGTAVTPPLTFAAGSHQLTAVFLPADPVVFTSSTSPMLILEVTQPGLGDLGACLRVLKDCPTPRVYTR